MIILQAVGLTLLSALIVGVTLLVFSLVSDGYRASMMRFEGEPPEGWEYWRRRTIYEALPGNIIFALMMLALACVTGIWWWRWARRLQENWTVRQPSQEQRQLSSGAHKNE